MCVCGGGGEGGGRGKIVKYTDNLMYLYQMLMFLS